MLIPLGFFGGGAAEPAFELIATAYGTGAYHIISFTSIPQGYKHLQARGMVRLAGGDKATMTAKLTGSTSYRSHSLYNYGTTTLNMLDTGSTSAFNLGTVTGVYSPAPANSHTPFIMDITDYTHPSKYKILKSRSGRMEDATAGYRSLSLNIGLSKSLSAVDQIDFTSMGGDFASTTWISIYGIKG